MPEYVLIDRAYLEDIIEEASELRKNVGELLARPINEKMSLLDIFVMSEKIASLNERIREMKSEVDSIEKEQEEKTKLVRYGKD